MARNVRLYLSLIPEALIASMLTPQEFGVYYAVGTTKKARGQAIFFEVDPEFRHDCFPIEEGIRRCVPHEDGSPKASIYISVYRVLEHVPLHALGKLYLVTADGRVLGLDATHTLPETAEGLHLYQEIAPVTTLVVSSLSPRPFYELIVKDPNILLRLPAICFAELRLGELATDPERGNIGDLPYSRVDHLRQCLIALATKTVDAKMVNRTEPATFSYRTISSGIFLGNEVDLLFYPFPSSQELRIHHYRWWRSAWSA
ncbi:MAG: hypothetical protein PVJ55_00650 [Anaerolineae bacterium]